METIVACATPWGRSAIALVRVSGASCREVLDKICVPRGGFPPPRRARVCDLVEGDKVFDEGLLTFFESPASYTGEDLAEISCHGNPLVVERLLAAAVGAGARMAHPGEFTRRAFLHGRMDLTRAEAVLQAIEASSSRGLELAQAGLGGAVSALATNLRKTLVNIVAELEARLDYPGEDLVYTEDVELLALLADTQERARGAADTWRSGRILVDGARVALVGPVNAGKSSLFNALGGSVRALVSDTPGTTRDVLERRVVLGSVAVTLLDSAGEREEAVGLEAEGLALARTLTENADLMVVVVPAHERHRALTVLERTAGRNRIVVANHADRPDAVVESAWIATCAVDGMGLEALSDAIAEALVGELPGDAKLVIASQRQRDLFLEIANAIEASREALVGEAGLAVAAEELYRALERIDSMTGEDTRESVLDVLFSRFCIGK